MKRHGQFQIGTLLHALQAAQAIHPESSQKMSTAKSARRKKIPASAPPTPTVSQGAKKSKPYRKQKISAALREQVWIQKNGPVFDAKCAVEWCKNKITVFDFQCGHDIPESKGGPTNITNLYPICGKCNLSMSNSYTLQEWSKLYEAVPEPLPVRVMPPIEPKKSWISRFFGCFILKS